MKMILPKKEKRGHSLLKSKSEISRQEAIDIIKISKYGGGKTSESFGHKTLSFLPDLKYIQEKTNIPAKRIKKLVKNGYIDNRFGYISTIKAFCEVWLYFGANPFSGLK